MKQYLADTTVVIDHLRGVKKATLFLEKFNPYISVITKAELIQGSRNKKEQDQALKLCSAFSVLSINKRICDRSISLMTRLFLSGGLSFLDALIASTVIENKLILVTANLKHFKKIKDIVVVSEVK
jgi:tRNA(fMet)-specific endonuclease VapC